VGQRGGIESLPLTFFCSSLYQRGKQVVKGDIFPPQQKDKLVRSFNFATSTFVYNSLNNEMKKQLKRRKMTLIPMVIT